MYSFDEDAHLYSAGFDRSGGCPADLKAVGGPQKLWPGGVPSPELWRPPSPLLRGAKSSLASKSMLAVGMAKRLVLTQPEVSSYPPPGHSPLAGRTFIETGEKVPIVGTVQVLSECGQWKAVRDLKTDTISGILSEIKAETPVGAQWAGALAYDLVQWTEPLRLANPPNPGAALGVFWLVENWQVDETSGEEIMVGGNITQRPPPKGTDTCSHTDVEHAADVRRIQSAIRAGELYQLNLGRTWSGPLQEEPLDIFLRLAQENPAPFSAYFEAPDLGLALVSCSPEILLESDGLNIMTAPIKGTRPRDMDEALDSSYRSELVFDRKERAEHRMLVDMQRHELSKVARPGSVVQKKFNVEAYVNVQHLVSQVAGQLAPGRSTLDALQSIFPGGSITGCPKTVVCAAIDELEGKPRSFWTGSLGWVDLHTGESTFNIMIRTLECKRTPSGWHGTIMAGGGITIESDPHAEAMEATLKAAPLRKACGWIQEASQKKKVGKISVFPLDIEHVRPEPESSFQGIRIAFIENYDSFSFNIIDALRVLGCEVDVFCGRQAAMPSEAFRSYDGIVLGPGPGRPETNPLTMSLAKETLADPEVPVLGICLGHQALGLADGMELIKSPLGPVHGVPCEIKSDGSGLLPEGNHMMTRYNSLVLSREPGLLRVDSIDAEGDLVMAVCDADSITFGVQYHPESVGSPAGNLIFRNFLFRVAELKANRRS
eukprot:CAMPEP_0172635780 /NCGR_PEP_ID=MMETSP1068-20121228/200928_1 /TAXON_ID=35684 /ORGANISM="Pseudopedinella elastica, Strain CCMP716" /LENGTH=714 /DNA_ID=CAMNT_0013448089 /DNA_START=169 /DNA_END=2314 /DNA_ORIENTATION=-